MAQAYIKKLKPPEEKEWTNHTTFWGANRQTGEPPWGFSISNLYELMNELERGHPSGVPYRLLALDSLKKILEHISKSLYSGDRIEIRGFGTFSLHNHNSRTARNPKTGELVALEKRYSVHFKPSKELKNRVDNKN